ncbi:hypothetical protein ACSBR2_025901 [Camellia fascicularis]
MGESKRVVQVLFLCFLIIATISIIPCYGNLEVVCLESEKRALLSFKQGLKDPSNRLSSWDLEDDCCKWAGVVCNNLTGHVRELHLQNTYGYTTQAEFKVYMKSKLRGEVNPSLLDLKHLNYLDLSGNDFGGIPIPSFLGSQVCLQYLNLSEAGFAGIVPHQLGNLSSLRSLSLKGPSPYDELVLEVENLQWLSGLSTLEHLDLSQVNLNKTPNWLQEINMLPSLVDLDLSCCGLRRIAPLPYVNFTSLVVLDLSENEFNSLIPRWIFSLSNLISLDLGFSYFEGPIPSGLQNMTKLRNFDLSLNYFNSRIPNWLYNLSHLELLDLNTNQLEGMISSSIENLTSIVTLDLSSNELEGRVARVVGKTCNLENLDLSQNKFWGDMSELFESLTKCKSLKMLYLGQNSFSGPIPKSIGRCLSLEDLDLGMNQLNGTLPKSLGHLSKLKSLYIDHNLLEGVVSEVHFINLSSLKEFGASRNQLDLKVSSEWIPPFHLHRIELGSWNLGPQFPAWLHSQKGFVDLDLSCTGILDNIPSWFWNLSPHFNYLNLSHNQIQGKIPDILRVSSEFSMIYLSSNRFSGPLPRVSSMVTELDLSNNSFSGNIFHFLCDRKDEPNKLNILHLGGNFLSGEIPDCWMNWSALKVIELGNNHLSGKIPNSLGYLRQLQSLHLRNNSLSGEVPLSLENCTELITIDLGWNQFVGRIPIWLGRSLSKLLILGLRSNNFYGKIPSELCYLTSLQILDLANNSFSGSIPHCFKNFTALTVKQNSSVRISYSIYSGVFFENAFVMTKGQEFQYNTILTLVTSMDLSDNNMSGEIPEELTSLLGLRSLNLSGNHLTGVIPNRIGDMVLLESLDLSKNQLFGEIPTSMLNLTFLSYLNLSYNKLSGRIPSGTQLQILDASSFIGNKLCGPPLTSNCTTDGGTPDIGKRDEEGTKSEVDWFYLVVGLGFVVGFWGIFGPFLFNKTWRFAYFQFLDEMWNKICNCISKC